ncbi:Centrosomal protein CEP57L1 [Leptosomus discolor]|uniref:Centrosomal protein 57kDa-like protein 1 n=1 Tax=Leptosomus discolor TaxID=188344 RepID=A0A091P7V1_LEPDC|nr:Centrosomal protein CEP57L1 [Leptosomus discolor]
MDSESKNSFIGSFLQPPDKMLPAAFAYVESKKLAAVGGDRPSIPNNQAVVAALKTLQEKIRHLELEKSQAEDNLCSLSIAAAQYKKALEHESYKKDIAHQELMQQRKDVSVQLNAAQSRCSLLEKQLDYMRKMVSSAELEKKIVLKQQAQIQKEEDQNWLELHAKLEKLEILEKEKKSVLNLLLLRELQNITLNVICLFPQLQTGFEINRILMSSVPSQKEPKNENGKEKKTKERKPTMKKMRLSQLHVKAGELPFVAGKSVSSSHSVSANVQRRTALSKSGSSCSTSPVATRSLSDLLLAVQDELGQMSFEHQELLKQIQEIQDSKVREDLERQLDCLLKQMEIKGEQISKLKKRQATVQKLKRKTQKLKQGVAHVELQCADQKEAKESAVTVRESVSKSCPGHKSRSCLQLLRNVRKLQSTLKKDAMWEQ